MVTFPCLYFLEELRHGEGKGLNRGHTELGFEPMQLGSRA